jgi:DNA mismatch repair ATPase MutS
MWVAQRGKPVSFSAAAARLTPQAAAALQLAVQHLVVTQAAQQVLPSCRLVCMEGLVGDAGSTGGLVMAQSRLLAAAHNLAPEKHHANQLACEHLTVCDLVNAHAGHMLLDACAMSSLELLTNSEGHPHGSLLHFLDRAATPGGRRRVKQFISAPLYRHAACPSSLLRCSSRYG